MANRNKTSKINQISTKTDLLQKQILIPIAFHAKYLSALADRKHLMRSELMPLQEDCAETKVLYLNPPKEYNLEMHCG